MNTGHSVRPPSLSAASGGLREISFAHLFPDIIRLSLRCHVDVMQANRPASRRLVIEAEILFADLPAHVLFQLRLFANFPCSRHGLEFPPFFLDWLFSDWVIGQFDRFELQTTPEGIGFYQEDHPANFWNVVLCFLTSSIIIGIGTLILGPCRYLLAYYNRRVEGLL